MTVTNPTGPAYGPASGLGQPVQDGALYFATDGGDGIGALYQTQLVGAALVWAPLGIVPPSPVNVTQPTISGTHLVGSVLTINNGIWSGLGTITYTYQWQRNGTNISAQTASTYTVVSADQGTAVTCVVTGTNSSGAASAQSALAVIFATGTGSTAQPITLPSFGVKTFAASASVPANAAASPFIQFPSPWSAVTDNPGVRLIIQNYSVTTPILPTLLNADNSTFAVFTTVEPGGGKASLGIGNETAAGVPSSALKLALQNLVVGDAAGFSVGVKAWAV